MLKCGLKPWEEVRATVAAMVKEARSFEISEEVRRKVIEELKNAIGSEKVRDEPHIRSLYRGGRYSVLTRAIAVKLPDIVVYPKSVEDVQRTLLIASKFKVPVTPVGNFTVPAVPIMGGIVLDMMSMNKIHKIDPEHNYVIIEPGVTIAQLRQVLGPKYLIAKGSYPASFSVLNPHACFGVQHNFTNRMWDNVIGLEVVMADGSIIYTGSMLYGEVEHWTDVQTTFTKLTDIFIPSHGCLGIITKAAIRIWPALDEATIFIFGFSNFESAIKWSHEMSKSPVVDQTMVYSWVATGFYGAPAALLLGLDWFEARANYEQDDPPQEISPFPYYGYIQTRGHSEVIGATLKAAQRIAEKFNGIYLPEEDLLKKPLIGGWYLWLLSSYLAKSPEEISRLMEEKASPLFKKLYAAIPKHSQVIAVEGPVFKRHFVGPLNEIIRLYEGVKNKLREFGWQNFSCYTRMFHYGQTVWIGYWPFIDATSPESAKRDLELLTMIAKWVLDNYKVTPQYMPFMSNDPLNPCEVNERVRPIRRLLRAIQKEFDPTGIMNPLAQKYTLA
ncbi:MAG: FAD-binding oxidoreductase [Candidatus Bathyarchaeia archaeon]